MGMIPAYVTGFDISATVSFFHGRPRFVNRKFYLRNLRGDSLEACGQEAGEIMSAVARELHYLTHSGIDKVTIRSGGRKIEELRFDYAPEAGFFFFLYALKVELEPAYSHFWTNASGTVKWAIPEEELSSGWERSTLPVRQLKTRPNIVFPCVPGRVQEDGERFGSPFILRHILKRKHKKTGWIMAYDSQDPVISRFLRRFGQDGNLAIGTERYFGGDAQSVKVSGAVMKEPKHKEPKVPRMSRLASLPTDSTDFVYMIRMGRKNVFKIGKTNDVKARLASLQTASPYKLTVVNVFGADNASAAEEILHGALRSCRMAGEWFRLTNEQRDALAAVERFEAGKFIVGASVLTAAELLEV